MTVAALAVDEVLVLLKVAFLVLLYTFIVLVLRSATRDLAGAPQESIVLPAAEAEAARRALAASARLVVLSGPGLPAGRRLTVTSPAVLGRHPSADIRLDGDDFASGRHARLVPQPDGLWVEDLGSTNGTFVGDERVTGRRLLRPGETLTIGRTELRLEP
ncbi:MAG: FHA domain-containing protein [Gaiellaceae bacterium]|nr:FHA domain-containing protein [Gaiellaceae bacterium]